MRVTSTTVAFTVADVPASAEFLARHFGYTQELATDGFASLKRPDAAADVVLLRRGIKVLPEDVRDQCAAGVILALVVDDLDVEYARLRAEGAPIAMPLREEEWGERLFQVVDPNGLIIELVQWVNATHSVTA
jgi:uncharacterized glyoxalase superfamily protein PhnB